MNRLINTTIKYHLKLKENCLPQCCWFTPRQAESLHPKQHVLHRAITCRFHKQTDVAEMNCAKADGLHVLTYAMKSPRVSTAVGSPFTFIGYAAGCCCKAIVTYAPVASVNISSTSSQVTIGATCTRVFSMITRQITARCSCKDP